MRFRFVISTMKPIFYLFFFVLLTACTFTAPVQEMSDARQAIRSAEEAGAAEYANERLADAVDLLQQAQFWLDKKAYANARQFALDARDEAISAREIALSRNLQ